MKRYTVMKIILSLFALGFSALSYAHSAPNPSCIKKQFHFESCIGSDTSKITLTLNDDNSFSLFDNTDAKKVVDISGIYIMKGKKIKLYEYSCHYPVHNVWKLKNNSKAIQSRKGLEFTRICDSN
jgi:hypothetical protein